MAGVGWSNLEVAAVAIAENLELAGVGWSWLELAGVCWSRLELAGVAIAKNLVKIRPVEVSE